MFSKADNFDTYEYRVPKNKEEALKSARKLLNKAKCAGTTDEKIKINDEIDLLVKKYKLSWKELFGR